MSKPDWQPLKPSPENTPDKRAAHALEYIALCLDKIERHLAAGATKELERQIDEAKASWAKWHQQQGPRTGREQP